MTVEQDGTAILEYHFASMAAAAETYAFLRSFFPEHAFVFQPVLH
jgi:hypothetical protein